MDYCLVVVLSIPQSPLKYPGTPLPLRMLAYFIVIFPSLDVCSIYPLVVLCMVNNIYLVLFGKDSTQANVGWSTIIGRMIIKFLCALIPILVAMAVSNLVDVLKYAGLLAFFTSLFFPPLFQITSQRACKKVFAHLLKTNGSIQEPMDTPVLMNGNRSAYVSINSSESTPLLFGTQSRIKPSELHTTPYSGVFSHPVFVFILGCLGLIFFALSVGSLFV